VFDILGAIVIWTVLKNQPISELAGTPKHGPAVTQP
jgi:hypothetical protein